MNHNALLFMTGAFACLFSLTAIGCGGGGATQISTGSSGIQGTAQITIHPGTTLPGEPAPTPEPYAGTTLAVEPSIGGTVIASTKTDAKGNFSFSLAPGLYLLVPELTTAEQQSAVTSQTQTVTVASSQVTAVTVAYSQNLP